MSNFIGTGQGIAPDDYDSKLITNGVIRAAITYDGYDLGITLDEIEVRIETDKKELMAAQNGTRPYDIINTGVQVIVTCNMTSPASELLAILRPDIFADAGTAGPPAAVSLGIKGDLYESLESKVLVIRSVLPDGTVSTAANDTMVFYKAIPDLETLLVAGPETQVSIPLTFNCYRYFFEGTLDIDSAFGYHGDPAALGIPDALTP